MKIWIARSALCVLGLLLGVGLYMVPAIAESVPMAAALLPGCGLLLGVLAAWVVVHFGDWQASETTEHAEAGAAADDGASASADESAAPEPKRSIFDDLPERAFEQDSSYRPSFDSVMFALGDVEGDGASASGSAPAPATPRGKVDMGPSPTVHVQPEVGEEASARVASDPARPIANAAAMSPFGAGEASGEPGSFEITGGGGDIDSLAGMFDTAESSPLDGLNEPVGEELEVARVQQEDTKRVPEPGTGRVDSVAVLSQLLGGDDLPDEVPRRRASTARPAAQMPATQRKAAEDEPARTTSPAPGAPARVAAPIREHRTRPAARNDALAGLTRDRKPSARKPARPAEGRPRNERAGSRAQKEQRVITARLQMGMVRREQDVEREDRIEIKDGFVPTPRKDAPDSLILLSKRGGDDFETRSADEIRQLYQEFVEALRKCGRTADVVQFKSFSSKIASQRSRVRAKYEGAEIEMQVRVADGRPKIVMRPMAV